MVLIKPDAINRRLLGPVFSHLFYESGLEILASKLTRITKELAFAHYKPHQDKPFFDKMVQHFIGEGEQNWVYAFVFWGQDAISKIRSFVGHTNPELASPHSLRGMYGRIRTDGIYENVLHASSDFNEAEREIKIWFQPSELSREIYPVKIIETVKKEKIWE